MSNSLWPHGLQHARLPCLSPIPGAYSNSCPSCWWCHPAISSSGVPFLSRLQSFPASGSFPMSQFFAWVGQSISVSALASVLPMNIQDWFPLGWTGWISLQSKGLLVLVALAPLKFFSSVWPQLCPEFGFTTLFLEPTVQRLTLLGHKFRLCFPSCHLSGFCLVAIGISLQFLQIPLVSRRALIWMPLVYFVNSLRFIYLNILHHQHLWFDFLPWLWIFNLTFDLDFWPWSWCWVSFLWGIQSHPLSKHCILWWEAPLSQVLSLSLGHLSWQGLVCLTFISCLCDLEEGLQCWRMPGQQSDERPLLSPFLLESSMSPWAAGPS